MSTLPADGGTHTHTHNLTTMYHGPVGRQLYSYTGPPALHTCLIITCSFCIYIVCILDVGNKILFYSITFLGISTSTPTWMILGDCGLYPLRTSRKVHMIRYFHKLSRTPRDRLLWKVFAYDHTHA